MTSYAALAGAPEPISVGNAYDGFPDVHRDASGRLWCAYRTGSSHAGSDGKLVLRFRDPGAGWSDPEVVLAPGGGYAYGSGGVTSDGTNLWLGAVKNHSTGPSTADDYSALVLSRPLSGGTWSSPVVLPAIVAGGTVMTSLYVHGGEILATAYGIPTGASNYVARVYAYNASASTWSVRGTVSISGRHATEPTLVTLADGRLCMLIRSDTNQPYYSYIHASRSSDGGATWTTPQIVIQHGTGLPSGFRLPSDEIAVVYRGFSEAINPPLKWPLRVAVLDAGANPYGNPNSQGVDVLGGETARFLYGGFVVGDESGEADRLVYALEGPAGAGVTSSAVLYEAPVRWPIRSNAV